MKIYTKKGDDGTTQLIGGTRVPKSHLRIESYGMVDELNSWIGLVRNRFSDQATQNILKEIQDRLFTIGSHLAEDEKRSRMALPDLSGEDILKLEDAIDGLDKILPELKSFILPGSDERNAICHIARCVCRRSERAVVALNGLASVDPLILQYLNRLSDYLFMLARKASFDQQTDELLWKPRQ